MARTKYDHETFPQIAEQNAFEGMTDEENAGVLGISRRAFGIYKNKHIEFREAIKRGKKPVDYEVKKALLKRALGMTIKEKITIMIPDKNNPDKPRRKEIRIIEREIPPDTKAALQWLFNRKAEDWRDKQNVNITSSTTPDFSNITSSDLYKILNDLNNE